MKGLTSILNWMRAEFPHLERSFHDEKNEHSKQVSNPTYGFGSFEHTYAKGEVKIHFQIGVAATSSGISFYLLGIRGKLNLPHLCVGLGKAKVTGYCIRFKNFAELDQQILKKVLSETLQLTN